MYRGVIAGGLGRNSVLIGKADCEGCRRGQEAATWFRMRIISNGSQEARLREGRMLEGGQKERWRRAGGVVVRYTGPARVLGEWPRNCVVIWPLEQQ